MANRPIHRGATWLACAGCVLVGCLTDEPGLEPDLGVTVEMGVTLEMGVDPDDGVRPDGGPDGGPDPRAGAALPDPASCDGVAATAIPAASVATTADFFDEIRPMSSIVSVVDLNCDGFDDVLIGVPLSERLHILYGSPAGLLNGRMLVVEGAGEPYAAQAADFDGQPGLELIVMSLIAGRWHLVGFDQVDGVPVEMARKEVDDTFADFRPEQGGPVPLHLVPLQLDEDPGYELAFGSLEHVRPWPLDWSVEAFGGINLERWLRDPDGGETLYVNGLFAVPGANGRDAILGTQQDRALVWQDDGAGFRLHSIERPLEQRTFYGATRFAFDPQTGWPMVIATGNYMAATADVTQVVPSAGPDGTHLFRRHTLGPQYLPESESNEAEGAWAGQFIGGAAPDVIVLDGRNEFAQPSLVVVLPDVQTFEDNFTPIGVPYTYELPRGYQPTGFVVGNFDGDGDVDLLLFDRLRPLLCLELDDTPQIGLCR